MYFLSVWERQRDRSIIRVNVTTQWSWYRTVTKV